MSADRLVPSSADEEHEAFRDAIRHFLAAEAGLGVDPGEVLSAAGRQGFLGIAVPEQHGGGGTDDLRFGAVVAEEAMRAGATAVGVRYGLHAWVAAPLLVRYAPAEQQQRWLPLLASGAALATVGGLHPGDGLHLDVHGDAVRVIGKVSGMVGADGADLLVSVANGPEGPAVVLLEARMVQRHPVVDELGAVGLGTADVVVDTEVPRSAVLGVVEPAVPSGPGPRDELRADHDLWFAVLAVAGASAALDDTVRYVRDRTVFGRPVAEFENTRTSLAAVAVDLAAAHALVTECIRAHAHSPASALLVSAAALAASAVHSRAVDQGLQLHGGYGYMREYRIADAFADARRLGLELVRGTTGHEAVAKGLGL